LRADNLQANHLQRPVFIAALLSGAIVVLLLGHLQSGAMETSLAEAWQLLWHDDDSNTAFVLHEIRLPRALNALLTGVALALSGLLIQVITRNPLGDPGLTGVTGGATFGVALVITLLQPVAWTVVSAGVLGGCAAASITFLLARGSGFRDIQMVLSGVAVSIFFLAATSALMILQRSSMQALYYWMIGGFSGKGWDEFVWLWPMVLVAGLSTLLMVRMLQMLLLEDAVARGLGVHTGLWRLIAAGLSVLLAAAAVAVAGPIAFIGFIAPHIMRKALDGERKAIPLFILMPMTALCGGVLTLGADFAALALPLGNRAPAGVLVTLFGGIIFLILARRVITRHTG